MLLIASVFWEMKVLLDRPATKGLYSVRGHLQKRFLPFKETVLFV